jgi:hypothetical protein
VRAELVIDGESVRTASADHEKMTEVTWYVKQFRGKEAVLRLVDDTATGHLNFDALRMDCFLDADGMFRLCLITALTEFHRYYSLFPSSRYFLTKSSSHVKPKNTFFLRL